MIENNFSSKKIDKVTIVKGIVFSSRGVDLYQSESTKTFDVNGSVTIKSDFSSR